MARFALIRPDNSIDRMASSIDPSVQTKSGWRWAACDPVAQPVYDVTTETVDGPTYSVGVSSVTEVWTKRSLTAQELSDRKDGKINGAGDVAVLVAFNHENRIRALEAKAPVTLVQFKAAIKALL